MILTISCLIAYILISLRGRAAPLPARLPERAAGIGIVSAVVGAHLGGVLTDRGVSIVSQPGSLFSANSGLSSAGGFLAAVVAVGLTMRAARMDRRSALILADLFSYAFPFSWLVARTGCAISHDHPGKLTSTFFAVSFADGGRYDCGLLEALLTPALILLAVVIPSSRLQQKVVSPTLISPTARTAIEGPGRHPGVLTGSMAVAYSLVRFPLDFLRATDLPQSDPRYLGMTAAQWVVLPVFGFGLVLLLSTVRRRP